MPLRVKDVDEFFRGAQPPEWYVSGLVPEEGIFLLTGDPGVSKTFFGLELCIATVTGTKFMGHFQTKKGSALFVGEDSPAWDVAGQTRRLLAGRGQDAHELNGLLFAVKEGAEVETPQGTIALLDTVKAHEPDLLVMDSLRTFHGLDENDAQEMGKVMRHISLIRDLGVTVVVLHHNSKPGQERRSAIHRPRGSTAITGASDVHMAIWQDKKRDLYHVEIGKCRGLSVGKWQYEFVVTPDLARFEYAADAELDADEARILELIGQQRVTRSQAIVALLAQTHPDLGQKGHESRAAKALQNLMAQGLVTKVRRGHWERVQE